MGERTGARNHRIKEKTARVHFRVNSYTVGILRKRCEELNIKKSQYITDKVLLNNVYTKVKKLDNSTNGVLSNTTGLLKSVGITSEEIKAMEKSAEREYKTKMEDQTNTAENVSEETPIIERTGNNFSIQIRVSQKEYEDIKENAHLLNMSLSEYLNCMARLDAAGVFNKLEKIEKKLNILNSLITLLSAQIKKEE